MRSQRKMKDKTMFYLLLGFMPQVSCQQGPVVAPFAPLFRNSKAHAEDVFREYSESVGTF